MADFFYTYFGDFNAVTISVLINIILIEAVLSIDNAAVLAGMVQDLPRHQQPKALKYGIVGAYLLRGLSLFFISILMEIIWLKILGGVYLCWLGIRHYFKKNKPTEIITNKRESKLRFLGKFWNTVILVELMDLAFSIDNVFACVALTDKIGLIIVGVFIGILVMRFIAQHMVKLLNKYPYLKTVTFVVIFILGLKLIVTGIFDYALNSNISAILNSHTTDIVFSITLLLLFAIPIFFKDKKTE